MASAAGARRSTASSLAKRHAPESERNGKASLSSSSSAAAVAAKKRQALVDITNQRNVSGFSKQNRFAAPEPSKNAQCTAKFVSSKKGHFVSIKDGFFSATLAPTSSIKQNIVPTIKPSNFKSGVLLPKTGTAPASLSRVYSPPMQDSSSVSIGESMSTCDSLNSPQVEYIDNNEIAADEYIARKACDMLRISESEENAGCKVSRLPPDMFGVNKCKQDAHAVKKLDGIVVDVDGDLDDPQLCATIAADIYKHLRADEMKKRPATDFMERVQKDINVSMRAILIDWLVEVAEEYRLVPETLYLAVNYIDRYLSENAMDRHRLQLLGVACMMIASKYEEICAPQVEEFCYITDNTYVREEVLQMESTVLNRLKFEMSAVTTKCFLRRFVRAAQSTNQAPLLQLECLSNYIAELSLVEYSMLCFAPSLVAASSVFLALFILIPSKFPWNPTLRHYTLHRPCDLHDCVMALHKLCCNSHKSTLPAIREKYSQHKYKFVAKKSCPPSIPQDYFQDILLRS